MRQFIAEANIDARGCLEIAGKKFHYLRNVLRAVPGDMISVRLPDGTLQQMTVASVDEKKKSMVLQVAGDAAEEAVAGDVKKHAQLWLFQFIAKPLKMELIVRQAVECGVSVVIPVAGKFCQSGAVASAKEAAETSCTGGRWNRIITEAREQSGSAINTCIEKCVTVEEACALWKKQCSPCAVVLYEQSKGTKTLHEAVRSSFEAGMVADGCAAVAVGAEGGIAPEEIDMMQKNGFVSVHFETNILRCETAALYGVATLQTALMENEVWRNNV